MAAPATAGSAPSQSQDSSVPNGTQRFNPELEAALPALQERSLEKLRFPDIGVLGYDGIDRLCRLKSGQSLYDFCNEHGALDGIAENETEFRALIGDYVKRFESGALDAKTALFNAYAEESSFKPTDQGTLEMSRYAGMNVPIGVVRDMTNEFFQNATFDENGTPHGTGTLRVDFGSGLNDVEITVDFDRKTVDPRLSIDYGFGRKIVTYDDVMSFFTDYLEPQNGNPALLTRDGNRFAINPEASSDTSMNIYLISTEPEVIRHEIMHALYDNSLEFRETVHARARGATEEQRECAVLTAACGYDVFDPDAPRVTRDIVLDEVFNAYHDQGVYNYETMRSTHPSFTIGSFCDQYDLTLALSDPALRDSGDMRLLRTLLMEQQPEFYERVIQTRRDLVDWVD